MKVTKSKIEKIYIKNIEGLDPITVFIEEYEGFKAEVTIKCWDQSWTAYWGSMGCPLKEFFTDIPYLINCFSRGIRSDTDEIDEEAMSENFITKVREYILEQRKQDYISTSVARQVWDECERVDLSVMSPDHCYDNWKYRGFWYISEWAWEEVWFYEEEFSDWMYNNCPTIYMENPDYYYLQRIVGTVKEVLTNDN
ncbi:hypothetical protein NVP1170O_207 [Vibrio phage 1.170.O._10N.261.52.C3]|nr:hypothetical protein NVP1170O_207 [Vibrio phage 1.170.O._10N.261.52.C3]